MVKVSYIGHSCFLLESGQYKLLIDPFISGNSSAKISEAQKKVDFILVTHGHGDHLGDAIELARQSGAMIIANYEIVLYCGTQGIKNCHPLHIGGGHKFPFGSVKLTIAHHGSSIGGDKLIYGGAPAGIIIRTGDKVIYHAGDTGIFLDMKLIGELDKIDLAILPIGGGFTMDIPDAVKAIEFLKPRKAIPMHYHVSGPNAIDPGDFVTGIKPLGVDGIVLKPGESHILE